MRKKQIQIAFIVLFIAVLVTGAAAFAKGKPNGGVKPCKYSMLMCLDVWDPVVCDDGRTYSNACYARRACSTGCTSSGGGVEY